MSDVRIFLSYARDDDAVPPGAPELKGFVTSLFEQSLYQFRDIGPEPRPNVWRDQSRIERGEQFDSKIEDAIAASSLFMVVLSKNWLSRPYCRRELECFAERWQSEGDEGIRSRIVVVGKRHVAPDERPALLQGQEGFLFYALEPAGGIDPEHEFFNWGKFQDPRSYARIDELATYLWRQAERLRVASGMAGREPCTKPASVVENGRTIFLAKPASDMYDAYDRLTKELTGRGYRVVPDVGASIPSDSSALGFVDAALLAAEASVHLLGDKLGPSPEDQPPITKFQLARAAARASAAEGFHRIVWAPRLLDDRNADKAGAPLRDPLGVMARFDCQLGTDKIEGDSLSKFVDFLTQHLLRAATIPERKQAIEGNSRVYLYHAPDDTDYAFALADALQSRRIDTILPAFDGPPAEIESFHRKNLVECDAVALCWANASEVWVRAQSAELRDWRGLGRKNPFAYRGVVAGPPPGLRKKSMKHLFSRSEIDVIVDLVEGRPLPELLDPLVPSPP